MENGVLRYPGRLCVLDVGELRQHIVAKAHNSKHYIHLGATMMYHYFGEIVLVAWYENRYSIVCGYVPKLPPI